MTEAKPRPRTIRNLSFRERDVVRLVAEGMTNKEIALELSVGEGTVKVHLRNVMRDLRLSGGLVRPACRRTNLALLYLEHEGRLHPW